MSWNMLGMVCIHIHSNPQLSVLGVGVGGASLELVQSDDSYDLSAGKAAVNGEHGGSLAGHGPSLAVGGRYEKSVLHLCSRVSISGDGREETTESFSRRHR